jgi:hypothetical protein
MPLDFEKRRELENFFEALKLADFVKTFVGVLLNVAVCLK